MATFFKNAIINNVGPTEQTIVSVGSTARATIVGLSLTNLTDSVVLANLTVTTNTTTGYYVKDLIIPPNGSARVVNGGEKLMLPGSNILKVSSNTLDSLDVIASYIEIV
jgi:hypothetical protein